MMFIYCLLVPVLFVSFDMVVRSKRMIRSKSSDKLNDTISLSFVC